MLCLRGNSQGVKLGVQNVVEVIAANICNQSTYAMCNGAQGWGGCVWLEYGHRGLGHRIISAENEAPSKDNETKFFNVKRENEYLGTSVVEPGAWLSKGCLTVT